MASTFTWTPATPEATMPYQCCPSGLQVEVEAIASGAFGSAICFRCGRWFLGPSSMVARGQMPRMPGDVFVDADGSFHTQRKSVRDLIASLSQ